jgi:hypothetical protein
MKSPQVIKANYIAEDDKANYSDLQVLESSAGHYVGTIYTGEDGEEPGSRDSEYFPNREEAEAALTAMIAGKLPPRLTP